MSSDPRQEPDAVIPPVRIRGATCEGRLYRDRQAVQRDERPRSARPRAYHLPTRAKDLELESNLHVTTLEDGTPVLDGGIHMRRGRITLSGQRFDFERGDIPFNGDPGMTPELDLRLVKKFADAVLVVELHGAPKAPVLRLTSDPPIYDQSQIVSLLLTGEPGGQPSNGKSFDPTAAVSGMVLGKLADKLAPEFGLDVFRVEHVKEEKTADGAAGQTDTRVEVGKYVSERIYLSYAHVFGASADQNSEEAHVEYT